MKITLDSNPEDAPCCLKIVAEDGRDLLVQTDWEWPGVASSFGWSVADCKPEEPEGYSLWQEGRDTFGGEPWTAEDLKAFADFEEFSCQHDGTDGTIDCPACGMKAGRFIKLAREWLNANDGAEAECPGYFEAIAA